MENHHVNRKSVMPPDIGEIVLVVGDESNRGEWKRGRVLSHIKGKDGAIRGVVLLHKGHTIERPLQLVCLLEIRAGEKERETVGDVETEEASTVGRKSRLMKGYD